MHAIDSQIKAEQIQPGMVVDIYGTGERIAVEAVVVKWGAVQIADNFEWRGLGREELVTVRGYFNL